MPTLAVPKTAWSAGGLVSQSATMALATATPASTARARATRMWWVDRTERIFNHSAAITSLIGTAPRAGGRGGCLVGGAGVGFTSATVPRGRLRHIGPWTGPVAAPLVASCRCLSGDVSPGDDLRWSDAPDDLGGYRRGHGQARPAPPVPFLAARGPPGGPGHHRRGRGDRHLPGHRPGPGGRRTAGLRRTALAGRAGGGAGGPATRGAPVRPAARVGRGAGRLRGVHRGQPDARAVHRRQPRALPGGAGRAAPPVRARAGGVAVRRGGRADHHATAHRWGVLGGPARPGRAGLPGAGWGVGAGPRGAPPPGVDGAGRGAGGPAGADRRAAAHRA